jgi:hypothetical protein
MRYRFQGVWNLRLEFGQNLSPTQMCTPELAPANEPAPAFVSGPPQWARRSFPGGFPGSAFPPHPDGRLLCPANPPLFPQERRPEREGSLRVLDAARIGDCRNGALRAPCQESSSTSKPRRVRPVFWPLTSPQAVPSAPILRSPEPFPQPSPTLGRFPVLWHDWPRCHLRRPWMHVVRSVTVVVALAPALDHTERLDQPVLTRAQRAQYRLSWAERVARNARPSTAQLLTVTLHGLPASFAHASGFSLRPAA